MTSRIYLAGIACLSAAVFFALAAPPAADAQFVAEKVNIGNVATHLFGGSDAIGGLDDWYLSNGVVQAIIDDVGLQTVPAGATAPPKQTIVGPTGGTLIDLGLVGDNNDQLSQMFTVGGLSTSNFITYSSVVGSTTGSSATLTCTGNLLGFDPGVDAADLDVVTEYTLNTGDNFLTITTSVVNNGINPATGLSGFLDAFIWTTRAIAPFSPLASRGFNHKALDLSNPVPALEQPTFNAGPGNIRPSDGVMDPTDASTAGEVSYGVLGVQFVLDQDGPGGAAATTVTVNKLFGVNSLATSAMGNVPISGSLNVGGTMSYTRRIYVGDRNDVASVSNDMYPVLAARQAYSTGTISGNIDASDTTNVDASVVVTRTAGAAVPPYTLANSLFVATHFRTDSTGAFSGIVLPVGDYSLEIRSPERDTETATVTVTAATDTPVVTSTLTGRGTVDITVFETIPGVGKVNMPGRLTFIGIDGSDNPNFNKDLDVNEIQTDNSLVDLMPETFPSDLGQRNFVYVADGTSTVSVRPGTYEVYGSRGPEYTIKKKKLVILEGKIKKTKIKLKRIVQTPDAMSADFHIHSARSWDASAGLDARVASFAGEQVEVMISTDHNYQVDYASTITALGIGDFVTSIVGNEATGSTPNPPAWPDSIGHINAWPLTVQPDAHADGATQVEFVAPNLIFSRLRDAGAQVVQYNHPRAGVSGLTGIGFFNNFGFDPAQTVATPPNDVLLDDDVLGPGISGVANPDGYRNIDFDMMEIANGMDIDDYIEVRDDWFSLLNQTDDATVPFIVGSGVSDSHRITLETAGYHRSYVSGVGEDPSALPVATFNTNIKAGRVMATTGPYIEYTLEDTLGATAAPGDTFDPSTSDVIVNIRVQSTHWIPVEEVRIVINGLVTHVFNTTTTPAVTLPTKPTSGSKKTVRFEAAVPVTLTQDDWILVEAGAPLSPSPTPDPFASQIVPGFVANAFTNPVFVDLDGDGFDPPGLPPLAPLIAKAAVAAPKNVLRSLDSLSEHERAELRSHFPIFKISIPLSAIE